MHNASCARLYTEDVQPDEQQMRMQKEQQMRMQKEQQMRTQKEQQKRMFILKKNNKVSLFA
jgi:hypothetical protein